MVFLKGFFMILCMKVMFDIVEFYYFMYMIVLRVIYIVNDSVY